MFTPIQPCTVSLPVAPLPKGMRYIVKTRMNARQHAEREDPAGKNTTMNITTSTTIVAN